jgi:hypothetical protein
LLSFLVKNVVMASSLRSLMQVAPPPSIPLETGAEDAWPRVEEDLGVPIPPDYREFVHAYGSGCFQRFLWPLNPFSEDENLNLGRQAPMLLWAVQEQKRQAPETVPHPVHPESGGLFPWGRTENGDGLYWLAEGDPARWPVVVAYGAGGALERFDRPTTTFLFQWLSGVIAPRLAPETPGSATARPFLSAAEHKNP